MSKNVVLIHGAFCGGWCFADIMPEFAQRGWTCQAPDLPFPRPRPGTDARSATGGAEHRRLHARHGRVRWARLPEPPIIVGHSMGGRSSPSNSPPKGLARAHGAASCRVRRGACLPSTEDGVGACPRA